MRRLDLVVVEHYFSVDLEGRYQSSYQSSTPQVLYAKRFSKHMTPEISAIPLGLVLEIDFDRVRPGKEYSKSQECCENKSLEQESREQESREERAVAELPLMYSGQLFIVSVVK
ncbi:hypothetical protein PTT_13480 [Pyrenophora teres f. teres 0-1]|uniref:Uncharacterized protein n=1 Tax=Pyrenophora teres f. teres (strain 0-1) TaxID=861557 RepID=E3RW72_PYRTT|nr:hypothetical protein PTT_13480 [Pyrenophora teres f. teres 0-1]